MAPIFVAWNLDPTDFNRCQVIDESAVELPEHVTSLELIDVVLQKANISWEELMEELGTSGKFHVPSTMVPQILELYHTSQESGGHDRFWRTYMKLTRRFMWLHMKDDTRQ